MHICGKITNLTETWTLYTRIYTHVFYSYIWGIGNVTVMVMYYILCSGKPSLSLTDLTILIIAQFW